MNKIALIKAEIKRLYDGEAPKHDQQCDFDDGYFTGIGAISQFLDTLSEEPDKSLKEVAEEYADETYYAYPPEFLEFVKDEIRDAFITGAKWQSEQFEKNRLAACEKQTKEEYDREMEFAVSIIEKEHRQPTFSDAINYGIEWQKKQIPMPEDTALFNKGVEEGKRLMMDDAVEGEVVEDINNKLAVTAKINLDGFKFGDMVRIIIVKEDSHE